MSIPRARQVRPGGVTASSRKFGATARNIQSRIKFLWSKAAVVDGYFFPGPGIGTFSSGTMFIRIAIFLAAFFFLGVFVLGMVIVMPEHFRVYAIPPLRTADTDCDIPIEPDWRVLRDRP